MQRVIPAILTQDPQELSRSLALFKGISDWMHIDIMDGVFVPEKTLDVSELKDAAKDFSLEVHLMVQNPVSYLPKCREVGASRVVAHAEAASALDVAELYSFQKSIALNPQTSSSAAAPFVRRGWNILVMGVHPGAQGRPFESETAERTLALRSEFPEAVIGVDGGVSEENAVTLARTGADYLVIGSKIMKTEDPISAFKAFERMVH